MAEPKAWQQILAQGLTSALPMIEQQRTLRRQQDETERGLRQQQMRQDEADRRINTQVVDVTKSTPDAEIAASNEAYMGAIRRARSQTDGSTPPILGASDRYEQDVARAGSETQGYGQRVADMFSRIDAPGMQRRREGEEMARTRTDVNRIGRDASADDFLMRLRLNNTRENPWVAILSKIGSELVGNVGGKKKGSGGQEAGGEYDPGRYGGYA
jgi:hypothetical protein